MEQKQNFVEEEKGISLSDLFFLVKRNIILIIIITGLLTVGGCVYGLRFKKITYTATSTAIVNVESDQQTTSSGEYQNYLYSTYLINTFKDFIVSNLVVSDAINSETCKKYNLSIKSVTDNTTITTSSSSLIITVKFQSDNEQKSIDIVNQIVNSTIKIANQKNAETDEYNFSRLAKSFVVMDYASENNVSASRGATLVIIVCFLVGFIISFAIILVKYLTDDTYTSKDDFERIYNINVLSLLPEVSEYNTKEGSKK